MTAGAEHAAAAGRVTRALLARMLRGRLLSSAAGVAGVVALCGALGSCGILSGSGQVPQGAEAITVAGTDALRWGDGPHGVVLAHGASYDAASWSPQAPQIAAAGFTVIAVEEITPEAISAAAEALRSEGIDDVALVGGSAGSDAILDLATQQPDLPTQLVLLSPNGVVEGLGSEPKLFIASTEEPVADVSTELAETAPGQDNVAKILDGSAHAQAILAGDQGGEVLDLIIDRLREHL